MDAPDGTKVANFPRHLMLLGGLHVVFIVAFIAVVWARQQQLIAVSALENATELARTVTEFRSLYTEEVVARIEGTPVVARRDYESHAHAIPLPATLSMMLGERLGTSGGARTTLYSPYPFPGRDRTGLPEGTFPAEAWAALQRAPDQSFVREDQTADGPVLRLAIADRMRPKCVNCHNQHPDSPKRDWKTGDVRGIVEVVVPLQVVRARATTDRRWATVIGATYLLIAGLGLMLVARRALADRARLVDTIDRLESTKGRLQVASRHLQAQNEELESVIYVTSHDLRSPLVNIQGFSHELTASLVELRKSLPTPTQPQAYLLDEDIPEALRYISTSASRMDRLLNGLLQLSRLGRLPLRVQPIDMNAMMREIADGMEFELREAGATVDLGELPSCSGDADQLRQVFANLLGNAIKYRAERPLHVSIRGSTDGKWLCYRVEDNGIGIHQDHHFRIFQIFHRLDPKGPIAGEGLGLTIVQRVIARHEGRIELDSTLGEGSVFSVFLPVRPSEPETTHHEHTD
jgi:signal transduction histidine kinase